MPGIVYPPDWRERLETPVFAGITADPTAFRDLLVSSVDGAFTALPEPAALCLSGGVDSSLLAAVLCTLGYRIPCLTLHDGSDHPDRLAATTVASGAGLTHLTRMLTRRPPDLYDALFAALAELGFQGSIHGDTVDEMQGGYPDHRWPADGDVDGAFDHHWACLREAHLDPMDRAARRNGVSVALPYLALSEYLMALPMAYRVSDGRSKVLVKKAAEKAGVPQEIVGRRKMGLVDAIRRKPAHG